MNIDLHRSNWIGIPGQLRDHENNIIQTSIDFAAFLDSIPLPTIQHFGWWNPCTQANEVYFRMPFPPFWGGVIFNIFAGIGMLIHTTADVTLPLKFTRSCEPHLICSIAPTDYYCELLHTCEG